AGERWPSATETVLVGAGVVEGGRIDHTLANLGVLLAEPHRRAVSVDAEGRLVALRHGRIVFRDMIGAMVSVIPWTLHGVRVSESGMRFPLADETLRLGGRGLSNVIVAPEA